MRRSRSIGVRDQRRTPKNANELDRDTLHAFFFFLTPLQLFLIAYSDDEAARYAHLATNSSVNFRKIKIKTFQKRQLAITGSVR